MYTYSITPKKPYLLGQIVQNTKLQNLKIEALEKCKVDQILIDIDASVWKINVLATQGIAMESFIDLAEKIQTVYKIKTVYFDVQYLDLELYLENKWECFADEIAEENTTIKHLLLNSKRNFDGKKLVLELFGDLAEEILTAHLVIQRMRNFIETRFHTDFEIECITNREEDLRQEDFIDDIMTPEYMEALKNDTTKETVNKAISIDKLNIFGKLIREDAQNISEIQDEGRNIIIAGKIVNLEIKELRTGRQLLLFDIADSTSGLSCKKIFDNKETIVSIMAELKIGLYVKLKGNVQHDKYANDYIMFVDHMQKSFIDTRSDAAEIKRVELHAHTHMSNMDAVVSIKNLINTAAKWGHPAIAITDHGVVQAFPEACDVAAKAGIKVIYGMEGYLFEHDINKSNHIVILAKNPIGLKNLYKIVSLSHLKFFHRRPKVPRKILEEYREGLLFGSACEAGELIQAIINGESDEELLKIAKFYDYLEIQPIGNNEFLIRNEKIADENGLRKINLKVAEIAEKLNLPLVATCDVHFLNPEDEIYRRILMAGKGFSDADHQPPLYLRTTEEMLEEFSYLGKEKAIDAVINNTRLIADKIEQFKPIPDELYSPQIPGAEEQIKSMAYTKAKLLYGDVLPKIVNSIIGHGFAVLYLIAHKLVKKSLDDGYLVGSRGSVGSSFVATMTDITEVNPLPPHWLCPNCKHSEFIDDGSYGGGFDLPDKQCPICNEKLIKNGHDIPFAVFMGFHGDKVPDIDLNFSGDYQPVAHKYTEELFGKDNVFRAGTIATIADKTAYGYVSKYFSDAEGRLSVRKAYANSLVDGCTGVKRTTGQHPGGIMVIPRDMDVHHFTPIQHPADDKNSTTITTHFDYHSISSRLVKLDILGHDDPTVIKMLEDLTGRDPLTIPLDDAETMSLFSSTEALKVSPEELGSTTGTYGIPEFGTKFVRQMLDDTKPKTFSELVRISGFSHGTDVWLNNAQDLIRNGIAKVSEAISARDDIMMYLIHKGVDPSLSFKTMESVRKGKGIKTEDVEKLRTHNIPEWYIDSCQKIKYMFPKAHAVAYVMMAYRIAYCKVHYPLAFYAAYFSVRATEFDADIISKGKVFIKDKLKSFEELGNGLSVKEKGLQTVLEMALEMYLRGYSLEKVNLDASGPEKFIILENSLLPPLASLEGVGNAAAKNIALAREEKAFTSIEDLKNRAKISKTAIDILRAHGCLNHLPETDQIILFG